MTTPISKSKAAAAAKASKRSDDGAAFLPDPYAHNGRAPARAGDDLAESLAEEFLTSATSGEDATQELRNRATTEEIGGPFVDSDARQEFASSIDETNPEDAPREPFPTANRSAG